MAQLTFNEQFYLSQNPDVVVAIARGQFANAQAHYNQFGAAEGRDPNAFFDSSFYLSQYPDVLNARVNPLDHFLNFGAAELRFANATADAAIDTDGSNFANEFNAQAYLTANPDLANAVGAGRAFENAYEHYVLFGQFENRPGTPAGGPFTNTGTAPNTGDTINLTNAVGENVVGTSGNDTFNAVVDAAGTFNVGDTINGLAGTDTLNLLVTATSTLPAGFNVSNVEIVNVTHVGASGALALNSNQFAGVEQLWQIDNTAAADNFQGVTVDADVTAGFRSTGAAATAATATVTVTAASAAQETINVALDGVDSGSAVTLAGAGLESATITGDLAGAGALTLTGVAGIETLNLGLTSDGTVTLATFGGLTDLNASTSTGDLTIDASTLVALETFTGGSGNDTLEANLAALTNETFVLNAGAGADTITFDIEAGADATAAVLTGGAGADIFEIEGAAGNLVAAADNDDLLESLVTISDFNASQDVLDISGLTGVTVARTAQNLVNSAVTAANATNLFEAVDAVADVTADNAFSVFSFGGNSYIYAETGSADGLDADDTLIQLTGVTVASLTADNFIV